MNSHLSIQFGGARIMSNSKRYTHTLDICFRILYLSFILFAQLTYLHFDDFMQVNSKYILKSTLTPRPTRKDIGTNLQKSRSCSSLEGNKPANNNNFNNYLTVHVNYHRYSIFAVMNKLKTNHSLLVFPEQ